MPHLDELGGVIDPPWAPPMADHLYFALTLFAIGTVGWILAERWS